MKHRRFGGSRPRPGLSLAVDPHGTDDTPHYLPNEKAKPRRMYAIAFDMDTRELERLYGKPNWRAAYEDIKRVLTAHNFDGQQGSVYFGDASKVDAVGCVVAVQDLTRSFAWFAPCVSDIRMLRIEDNNDLRPAMDETRAAMAAAVAAMPPPG